MKKVSKRTKILVVFLIIVTILIVFRNDLIYKPYHYYRSLSAKIDRIELTIPEKGERMLDSLRSDVLKNEKIAKQHKKYVKAELSYQGETFKVKMRLKGDMMDHYQSDPPSYRIKVKGNKTVLGTNKFSIQSFAMRNCVSEWIYLKMLTHENILALKMDIVELVINGRQSIYTFEEHFTHHLTDRFERPRGPIICISEEYFWKNGKVNDSIRYQTEEEIYLKSPVKVFKYYADLDSNIITGAEALLNGYRDGAIPVDQAFDVDLLGMYYAISDLTNTHHALRWHNNRFYYNTETSKLEPIGFDGSSWGELSVFAYDDSALLAVAHEKLFTDRAFSNAYLESLKLVSSPEFLDQFFEISKVEIREFENKIFKKDLFFPADYSWVYNNAEWIRNHYDKYESRLLKVVN